ncbi:helix-turn-helix transcriptional regulator [Sporolituus thermophilus]|uniref:DNA-binding transcriptional regulator, XRE-family HTH domain n=1 Tax=Sporolituus thermophilus DSM 23256 TaxID=1123285 RepID=A0A1G7K008_9FIRM|nr:helix-turn-helix transcriptional regulator [Sporolituus thermophilus]SDF30415.1 DNA-binding transcriptional regulator, XRE-family HTH domain [Sporolituus thermophilus DSM 23256]
MKLTKLKLARLRAGLKQTELAKMLGVSPSYINKIENNAVKPTMELLFKLCRLLDISPYELD